MTEQPVEKDLADPWVIAIERAQEKAKATREEQTGQEEKPEQ